MVPSKPFYTAVKRVVDILGALLVLAVLCVLTPVLAFLIRRESPGPVFFVCDRLGRKGRPFRMVKFRTMTHGAADKFNPDGSRLVEKHDSRVTRIGSFLRGGLDELPQAGSILRGVLSFVGPRPDDLFARDLYKGTDVLKLAVLPGLTGLAQVNGRNELPYAERLKYDAYYALKRSLWLDTRIVWRTGLQIVGIDPRRPLVARDAVERVLAEYLSRHNPAA